MNVEYECKRCLNRFNEDFCQWLDRDIRCPVCGSTAVDMVTGSPDSLDVLRTRGAGSGGG